MLGLEITILIEVRIHQFHDPAIGINDDRHIVDTIQRFQHRFQLCDTMEIMWGLGYRVSMDSTGTPVELRFDPSRQHDQTLRR